MKIYLAGPCDTENRTMMVSISKFLRNNNMEVYCPWELKIENAWNMSQEEWAQKVFEVDIKAIQDCDYMLSISIGRISSAGTAWEQGYAMGINKPVAVIQINEKNPTSLMTYCGCNLFTSVKNTQEFWSELQWVIDHMPMMWHGECKTILT